MATSNGNSMTSRFYINLLVRLLYVWTPLSRTSNGVYFSGRAMQLFRDSNSSQSPNVETKAVSVTQCAALCFTLECSGFFFNLDERACSIYDVSLHSLPLAVHQGTHGYQFGPVDCRDFNTDGLYLIYPRTTQEPIEVYCDMTNHGGGWLVIQRRTDGSEYFFREWDDYKRGFGDLNNEFWLGNTYIHRITSRGNYELRIDLEDFENEKRFASYDEFSVQSEDESFRVHMKYYDGNADDAMVLCNNRNFTTWDMTGGYSECARQFGGGWWYGDPCHKANLNGLYLAGKHATFADGIEWKPWHGYRYSLKRTTMKIRRKP